MITALLAIFRLVIAADGIAVYTTAKRYIRKTAGGEEGPTPNPHTGEKTEATNR
jgi:hypothetical protein